MPIEQLASSVFCAYSFDMFCQQFMRNKSSSSASEILWDRWRSNAGKHPDSEAIIHWTAGIDPYRWTFAGLVSRAESLAALLLDEGIKPGEVCALIIRHHKDFYPLYLAVSCVGAIPAVLAYPNPRLHPDKFRQGLEGMAQRSGLDWILTERNLEAIIRPLVEKDRSTIRGLHFPLEWTVGKNPDGESRARLHEIHETTCEDGPFLLQHSSGTTGLQKPVLLSHRAVLQHVRRYGDCLNLNEDDKVVNWLPLYHDMGLIAAFHLPLALGIPSVQIDAFQWVVVPSLLLEVISRERGTISWLPNFAYNMMAEKIRDEDLQAVNLESWRLVINCSEPVRHESHQKFLQRFQRYGLKPTALSASYAMAETTFAVTQVPPGSPPALLCVDRNEMARGMVRVTPSGADVRVCVSSGRVIPGCRVKIVDENRVHVPTAIVGEVAIQSVSMFDGYRNYPEKTAEVLANGWFFSGDYGFVDGEELYVVGRKKDLIIVAGNNIYPEDVEDAVGKVSGVIPGRVVAFGREDAVLGSERLEVIAETEVKDAGARKKLVLEIIKAGMGIDVTISDVHLVAPRWLIKSSAGKPSRKANKERILEKQQTQRIAP